jgi:hypothetical protein
MKRFKTKQELKDKRESVGYGWMKNANLFGLPYSKEIGKYYNELFFTTDPHPFDNLDIKVRVTPKQSKKLQKKAFKMGYKWHGEDISTLRRDGRSNFLFLYKEGKRITRDISNNEHNYLSNKNTELTYKQFMNGTVPKMIRDQKEFKVGDWVEILKLEPDQDASCFGAKVGDVVQVVDGSTERSIKVCVNGSECYIHKDKLKHTTKPKEKPLRLGSLSVTSGGDFYKVGCRTITKPRIETIFEELSAAEGEGITPNEVFEFMKKYKERLGL